MSLSRIPSKVLRSCLLRKSNLGCSNEVSVKYSKIWEPDYLILGKTKTPEYNLINIQIKGYDYIILEKYQKVISRIAKQMRIKVNSSWASPQQHFEVKHFKTNSAEVQYEYKLRLSERNLQVLDVKSNMMSLFIEMVLTTCPPGVFLSVHEHEDHMEEVRYVPNYDLLQLKEDLENADEAKPKKKKKN